MALIRSFRPLIIKIKPVPLTTNTRNIKRWVAPTLKELYRRSLKAPPPVNPRNTFLEWNYNAELYGFGKRLGEDFDKNTLKTALTHRSYYNNKDEKAEDNTQLIQEGDDIINKYIEKYLYKDHADDVIEAVRKYLTTEEMLGHVGFHLGLKDLVLTAEYPVENKTLALSFKAVVGALNRSQNLERAEFFVRDFLICQLADKEIIDDIFQPQDPVKYLKDLLNGTDIEPRLCNKSASNTILANFQVGLYTNKKLLGIGWGEDLEMAQKTAALDAIKRLYTKFKRT